MLALLDNKKPIFIGGWILVAVLLLLYNGFVINNFYKPQASIGMENLAHLKLKCEDLFKNQNYVANNKADRIDYDRLFSKFTKKSKITPKTAATREEIQKEVIKKVEPKLPDLTGIVKSFNVYGKIRLLAMLDGLVLSEQGIINEFKVEKITEKGITLKKGEDSWYIQAPEVVFSLGTRTK
ncbi:hypothetical protein BuS5_03550 [Desulfosarcina sp. BuS5]|uniref:hypothetical protein n=1 Tax=Desulfosarcina sp. BuS5 TaxID=933262 RepID=UPI0004899ECF|nr:hypothetical protein [Desulfosarcina sp. BuS5]WDN90579.1 hypothetical protein BuS5_03550 [Desulfosarcina sp. BuS5]